MRAESLPDTAFTAAAEYLASSVDVLLDRLAAKALAAPAPGSPQWQSEWSQRHSAEGAVRTRRHLLARIAIASRANVGTASDVARARAAGARDEDLRAALGKQPPARSRTRQHQNDRQLSFW